MDKSFALNAFLAYKNHLISGWFSEMVMQVDTCIMFWCVQHHCESCLTLWLVDCV